MLTFSFVVLLIVFLFVLYRVSYYQKLLKPPKKKKEVERKKSVIRYFSQLEDRLEDYFAYKKGAKVSPRQLYLFVLSLELLIFLLSLGLKKPLFALFLPLIVHWFVLKVLHFKTVTIHHIVEEELPHAIKHLVKVLSRISDLRLALHEMSLMTKDPLRSMFSELSRRMMTEKHEDCLNDFASRVNNVWIHAFVFLLISYKEQSKKEDVIRNLMLLATMIEKENDVKEKAITDRKFLVIVNYVLAVISFVAFGANLMFNDFAKEFFFQRPIGMIAFVFGIALALGTVVMNLFMTRKQTA